MNFVLKMMTFVLKMMTLPVRGADDCIKIEVKGAAEHRPALTFGDVVKFRTASDGKDSVHTPGFPSLPGNLVEVSFQWNNPDFLLKNVDLLSGILISY